MAKLAVTDLVKRYGSQTVVKGFNCQLQEGKFLVLLGPSGCGKTTILRMVAGLLHPDAGEIRVDGRQLAGPGWGIPPEQRQMAMVFQNYAVWPHKTVYENVAYGLRIRGIREPELGRRVTAALRLVHLGALAKRYPAELSGGQQQRVALARALVVEPAILLLDEPLSNLDAVLREQMRFELREIQRQLGVTAIHVTHDQAEAMVLADHLVVLRDGVVEQEGRPEEMYLRPATRFVAGFLGATNLVPGTLAHTDGPSVCLECPGLGPVWAFAPEYTRSRLKAGDQAWVSIRPVELVLSALPPENEGLNRFAGRVESRCFLGELLEYVVQAGGLSWKVRTHPSEQYQPGQEVWVSFAYEAGTVVLDTDVPAASSKHEGSAVS